MDIDAESMFAAMKSAQAQQRALQQRAMMAAPTERQAIEQAMMAAPGPYPQLHAYQQQAIDRFRRPKQVPTVMVMEVKPPRIPDRGHEPSWANLNGRWL